MKYLVPRYSNYLEQKLHLGICMGPLIVHAYKVRNQK